MTKLDNEFHEAFDSGLSEKDSKINTLEGLQ